MTTATSKLVFLIGDNFSFVELKNRQKRWIFLVFTHLVWCQRCQRRKWLSLRFRILNLDSWVPNPHHLSNCALFVLDLPSPIVKVKYSSLPPNWSDVVFLFSLQIGQMSTRPVIDWQCQIIWTPYCENELTRTSFLPNWSIFLNFPQNCYISFFIFSKIGEMSTPTAVTPVRSPESLDRLRRWSTFRRQPRRQRHQSSTRVKNEKNWSKKLTKTGSYVMCGHSTYATLILSRNTFSEKW